ncbi:chromosome partitioning protein ParB [Desulfomarina profundi]|uniref:Chromosome partitioning protein ParB n=1 Tax=Desulfomarina profundi TaxID=2772557 RepID=A0A8D5FZE0_9BACT|nr:ParB/RepB/Spo0J family partition protein [Desulfomarina profundi]BCL62732.1 chromosome partitioning protein ParB [Desulfomarina profundi]
MIQKKGLGQGVGLLFGEEEEKFFECDIDLIYPNKLQPRTHFKEDDLNELAHSIKENGIIQPLIVTHGNSAGKYELIAGERRLRASKLAGLSKVPVVLMDVTGEDALLELALIENIQRTDLNPIEEALAYKSLIDKFSYTQDETAKKVGKKRSTIANMLRLLKLPDYIQQDIISGILSEGHGRALIRLLDDPIKLKETRDTVIRKNLSVRQTEAFARKFANSSAPLKNTKSNQEQEGLPASYKKSLVNQLTNRLNSKVVISENGTRGKIEIEYYSLDDLDRLFVLLLNDN